MPRLPDISELERLPTSAIVAFAARCARRASVEPLNALDSAIELAESYSHSGFLPHDQIEAAFKTLSEIVDPAEAIRRERDAYWKEYGHMTTTWGDALIWRDNDMAAFERRIESAQQAPTRLHAAFAAKAAVDAARAASVSDSRSAAHFARQAAEAVLRIAGISEHQPDHIYSDYELLLQASPGQLSQRGTLPDDFFALNSHFDTSAPADRKSIIEVASEIQLQALHILGEPSKLYQLTPRQFEELIAELFSGFGFSVELTQQTRDGGKDIIAVRHDLIRLKFLIECKRYAPERSVGIAVVQRLHGVTFAEGANKGLVVTTGRLTQPAKNYIQASAPWLLDGVEYERILDWLKKYQKSQLARR